MKTSELNESLADKEALLKEIKERLKEPTLSDDSVRSLLKTKNELIADIQAIKMDLHKLQENKSLSRALNESFEL